MKLYKIGAFLLGSCAALMPSLSEAQYCTPTVSSTGVYFILIDFSNPSSAFTGGVQHSTTNGGYTVSSTSSGTVKRYFGGSFFYGVANNGPTSVNYNIGVFADWNSDFDFNDAGEQNSYPIGGTVPGASSQTTGTSLFPPLNMAAGNYRVRMAVSQGSAGTPNPCGPLTGEVEDYTITVAANTAPVLNNANSPVLNTLFASQTNSNGMSLSELIEYFASGTNMVTDADDNSGGNFVNKVPRGIAIYDQSAANGAWQYKIGNGAWTNIGAVSATNALLLMANASNTAYQPNTRIRFVPTGTGTPTLSFKAWDGTNANNGTYGTTAVTGGTSAFSTANNTASLPVVAPTGYTDNIYVSTTDSIFYKGAFNRSNKTMTNTEPIISGNINYQAADMELLQSANKLYWLDAYATDILSANLDGTGVQTLVSGLNYATGMAIGNNKLYYIDYSSDYSNSIIYKANINGTGSTAIYTTSGYADTRDMDYYNGKLYFQYSDGTNSTIASIDTAGAGLTTLITSANTLSGISIKNDTIYWVENSNVAGGLVKKRAISGGATTQLAAEPGRTFYDLMVDPATSTVYFTDADANGNNFYTLLRKVSTTGTGLGTAATLSGTAYSLAFNGSASVPLPVSLLDLKGRYDAVKDKSLLEWATASEAANTTFELERSFDGSRFEAVTSVSGRGTKAAGFAYSYEDNLDGVEVPTVFYRVKEMKADDAQYSKVVALDLNKSNAMIRLWPNPGKGIFNIQLSTMPVGSAIVKVYSNDGRLVKSASVSSKDFQLNLSDKPAGLYFVQIGFADGTQKQLTISKE